MICSPDGLMRYNDSNAIVDDIPLLSQWIKKIDLFSQVDFFGGSGWIRTTEVRDNRFTVCPLWPLGNTPILNWSWWTDSNPRPADYKSAALPTELHQRFNAYIIYHIYLILSSVFLNFFKIFFKKNFCLKSDIFLRCRPL